MPRRPIAITDWPIDSVACLPRDAPGGGTDGILFLSEESRSAQVPYRSLLPVGLDNLLVPVALSGSHAGWGSIRLNDPLTEAVQRIWKEGLTALKLKRTRREALLNMWRAIGNRVSE